MSDIIIQFNKIVLDLLQQTTNLIGSKHLFNYKLMVRMNSSLPIDKFINIILPLRAEIINKDIDFLLSKAKSTNININEIIDLENIFKNIDDNSKENIWQILHALILLAHERVVNKTNNISS